MFSKVKIFGVLVSMAALIVILMAIFKYNDSMLAEQNGLDREIELLQDDISALRKEVHDKELELKTVQSPQFIVFVDVASPEDVQQAKELIDPFGWPMEFVLPIDRKIFLSDTMLRAIAESGCGVVFSGNPADAYVQSQAKTMLQRLEKAGVRNDNFWFLSPDQNVEEAKQSLAAAGYRGYSYITDYEARILHGKDENGMNHFEYVPLYHGTNRTVGTLPLAVETGSTSAFYISRETWSKESQESGDQQLVIGKLESIQKYVDEQSVLMKNLPDAIAAWDAVEAEKAQKEEELNVFREEQQVKIDEIQKELNQLYGEKKSQKEKK